MPSVLVVGSGAAGLAAAVSAAESGAEVLVLDRAPKKERGGNTFYTESSFRLASENELAPHFREDFVSLSGGRCDLALVDTLATNAVPTIQWIRDAGVRFDASRRLLNYLASGHVRTVPQGGGAAILDALEARARNMGVEFAYERIAHSLTVENGKVTGVEVIDPAGREGSYEASAVVLACGGFEGNPDMEREYFDGPPEGLRLYAPGGRYNQGEGIEMALRFGAQRAGDFGKFHACVCDPRSEKEQASLMCYSYGVLLNRGGERFIDEGAAQADVWYEEVARAIWRQPGSVAYLLLDDSFFRLQGWQRSVKSDQAPIVADSLEELVGELPFENRERAMRTLQSFNDEAMRGGVRGPDLDGAGAIVKGIPKSNWAYKLESAPFRAFPIACANVFTFGGLQITPDGQVVSVDGTPLPGLFAAGETIGLYYGRYVGATSVMRGLVFGRIAGRAAALQG